jgi:class 3 adenylate cyclase
MLFLVSGRISGTDEGDEAPVGEARVGGVVYAIYCRIGGMAEMATGIVAAAVLKLAEVTCANESYSSPFGRIVLVRKGVGSALSIASSLRRVCADAGVPLAIGVACGHVEVTQDVDDDNVTGHVINRAARLAHLKDGVGLIFVDEFVHQDLASDSLKHKWPLSPLQHGQVKHTELQYSMLLHEPPASRPRLSTTESFRALMMHVVVYDLVDFSGLTLQQATVVLARLRQSVRCSLETAGLRIRDEHLRRYASSGDGGVVVSTNAPQVWTFVQTLLDQTHSHDLRIRVGVTTGSVVFVGDNYPAGRGVCEADRLSSLPEAGCVCVSRRFWHESLGLINRAPWRAHPVESDQDALLLRARADS